MKLITTAVAFATLAVGLASAANAYPHHGHCHWVMEHHHRMKRC